MFSNKQQPASVSPQVPLPQGTRHSQPRLKGWLHLGISKPCTSSSHLSLLYSPGRVAQGKTHVGANLGLYHPGNPRVSIPSGQLQTMLKLHHPAPAQLILQRGWMLVVSGHRQPSQLIGLAKFLPLTCIQQARLNKRRVYSAHRKDAP